MKVILLCKLPEWLLYCFVSYLLAGYTVYAEPAQTPLEIQDAQNNIVVTGSGTGVGASGRSLVNGNGIDLYVTEYNAENWWGELHSFTLTETKQSDGSSILGSTENWKASEQFPPHQTRQIFTRKYDAISNNEIGLDFSSDNIEAFSVEQQKSLGVTRDINGDISNRSEIQELINYLRGDSSNAGINATDQSQLFRYRTKLLGDIVHAKPEYVRNASYGFPDDPRVAANQRYSAYKAAQENRQAMVYAGANDGIFHAFSADTGIELFGFIPDTLFSRLVQYSDPDYSKPDKHRYFLDGKPTVTDAKVAGEWQTVIAVPFGAGGKGLFALNITDPATVNNEQLLLWEINDKTPLGTNGDAVYADIGHILGQAKITRIKDQSDDEHWVLITANGVHSTSGKAVVYIINLDDGSLRQKIVIDDNPENGSTSVAAVDLNADTFADRIYTTSLNGKVWRFDYDASQGPDGKFITRFGTEASPEPLFIAKDKDQNPQPITGGVVVSHSPMPASENSGVMVSFGTGKFFDNSDLMNANTQSFYTFWDKDFDSDTEYIGKLSRDDADGDGIYDNKLVEQTISNSFDNSSRTISNEEVDYANGQMGWYADLPDEGERIISKSTMLFNRLTFNTMVSKTHNSANESDMIDKYNWLIQVNLLKGGAFVPGRPYFAGQDKDVLGLKTAFRAQLPGFIQLSDGSISSVSLDKEGKVLDATKMNIGFYRSSRRQLQ